MKKIVLYFVFGLWICACGKEEVPGDLNRNPCEGKSQIGEVTIEEVNIEAVDNDNVRGYIIKAKITNHTDERLEGEPTFAYFVNGIPNTVSGAGICGDILANSTCLYENVVWERERPLDFSVSMECYYYTLTGG